MRMMERTWRENTFAQVSDETILVYTKSSFLFLHFTDQNLKLIPLELAMPMELMQIKEKLFFGWMYTFNPCLKCASNKINWFDVKLEIRLDIFVPFSVWKMIIIKLSVKVCSM